MRKELLSNEKMKLLLLFCIIGIGNVLYCTAHPEAVAPIGKIRGSVLTSRLGKEIYSFRGVRYAEPPTGERRFQVATPAADWNDVFDASEEGPACPNVERIEPISEDCLRLNVYTKKLSSKNENVSLPVLVFFHPGGFYQSSAQSFNYGPEYLLDHDIVLVTVNYRLATLGFIATGDSLAPGNLGLKDQVIALRWIQRNIVAFGGDPNSVTISGCSVGGLSTFLHMLSPMSKNLFHRVIDMSGSPLLTEPYPTHQRDIAEKQAKLLNCPINNTKDMLACLRSKPVANFTKTISEFFEWYGDPIVLWKPVVEPEVPGMERFLPAQPIDLIRQGKFYQVPAIFGVTKDELGGIVVTFENITRNNGNIYRNMNENWYHVAPISFIYERNTPRSKNISTELRKFYLNDEPLGSSNRNGLAHLYADSVIIFSQYRGAKLIAENSKAPVYLYKFTYQGRYSFTMWNATTPYGVEHQDDLQYLYYIKSNFPYFNKTAPEIPMVELYTSMWSSFVQTGQPIPNGRNITWNRFESEKSNYLDINLNPTMKTGFYPDRMQEWEKLFPLSAASQSKAT
ncbi:esterase E4-like [Bombus huntii]|uniref:esterase E4-like n=1 Tax=Bombus huntii TaxID=85661 RepID=UPI0021AAB4DB|nr:esterase E4-like [Bombus huntii]XP_050490851.1 esterase E4-like [Bombus huntii]